MKKFLRLLLFGFLSWLLTFSGALCLTPLRQVHRTTFETLIGVVLTISTVLFCVLYFRKVRAGFLREGVLLGMAFFGCNILFDLPMFLAGPMKVPMQEYLRDVGLAYLSMIVISIGFGYHLRQKFAK